MWFEIMLYAACDSKCSEGVRSRLLCALRGSLWTNDWAGCFRYFSLALSIPPSCGSYGTALTLSSLY